MYSYLAFCNFGVGIYHEVCFEFLSFSLGVNFGGLSQLMIPFSLVFLGDHGMTALVCDRAVGA